MPCSDPWGNQGLKGPGLVAVWKLEVSLLLRLPEAFACSYSFMESSHIPALAVASPLRGEIATLKYL